MVVRAFTLSNTLTSRSDGSAATGLLVRSLSVTFDKSWSPYCQAQLVVQTPGGPNIGGVEPRTGLRGRWTLGQDNLNGQTFAFPFDLALRSRSLDWAAGTATLALASDEALWQDWAGDAQIPGVPDTKNAAINAAQRLGWVVNGNYLSLNAAPNTQYTVANPTTADNDESYWPGGQSAWDYAAQAAELAGAWLFADETAVMRFAPKSFTVDPTSRTFDDSTIINVVDSVSRDDSTWASSVVVAYQPPGGGPQSYVTSDAGINPRKTISVSRARKKPANGNAATAIRTAAQARGRVLTIDAIADIRVRPNQPGVATYQGQSFAGTIRAVTFNMPAGTMQVTLDVTE